MDTAAPPAHSPPPPPPAPGPSTADWPSLSSLSTATTPLSSSSAAPGSAIGGLGGGKRVGPGLSIHTGVGAGSTGSLSGPASASAAVAAAAAPGSQTQTQTSLTGSSDLSGISPSSSTSAPTGSFHPLFSPASGPSFVLPSPLSGSLSAAEASHLPSTSSAASATTAAAAANQGSLARTSSFSSTHSNHSSGSGTANANGPPHPMGGLVLPGLQRTGSASSAVSSPSAAAPLGATLTPAPGMPQRSSSMALTSSMLMREGSLPPLSTAAPPGTSPGDMPDRPATCSPPGGSSDEPTSFHLGHVPTPSTQSVFGDLGPERPLQALHMSGLYGGIGSASAPALHHLPTPTSAFSPTGLNAPGPSATADLASPVGMTLGEMGRYPQHQQQQHVGVSAGSSYDDPHQRYHDELAGKMHALTSALDMFTLAEQQHSAAAAPGHSQHQHQHSLMHRASNASLNSEWSSASMTSGSLGGGMSEAGYYSGTDLNPYSSFRGARRPGGFQDNTTSAGMGPPTPSTVHHSQSTQNLYYSQDNLAMSAESGPAAPTSPSAYYLPPPGSSVYAAAQQQQSAMMDAAAAAAAGLPPRPSSRTSGSGGTHSYSTRPGRPPCKYFLEGYCNRGDRCTFAHISLDPNAAGKAAAHDDPGAARGGGDSGNNTLVPSTPASSSFMLDGYVSDRFKGGPAASGGFTTTLSGGGSVVAGVNGMMGMGSPMQQYAQLGGGQGQAFDPASGRQRRTSSSSGHSRGGSLGKASGAAQQQQPQQQGYGVRQSPTAASMGLYEYQREYAPQQPQQQGRQQGASRFGPGSEQHRAYGGGQNEMAYVQQQQAFLGSGGHPGGSLFAGGQYAGNYAPPHNYDRGHQHHRGERGDRMYQQERGSRSGGGGGNQRNDRGGGNGGAGGGNMASGKMDLEARFAGLDLDAVKGQYSALAKDQHGCRFLQRKLEEGGPVAATAILDEVVGRFSELMTDPFGNYLCQKLLEHVTDEQKTAILTQVSPHLAFVSLNMHGTRAVQKLVEHVSTAQQAQLLVQALSVHTVTLVKDLNGNHVIQKCLVRLPPSDAQFIYDAVTQQCVEVSTHRHGCCVIQRCLDYATTDQRRRLAAEITGHSLLLVKDPFGNYVVQYVLDMGDATFVDAIAARLRGHVPVLSMQKFASNVMEKCIRVASPDLRRALIAELYANKDTLDSLLRDGYANYVVQSSIDFIDMHQRGLLCERLAPLLPLIRNTPYGKRIMTKLNVVY